MHNPFKRLHKKEWVLMCFSLAVVIAANILSGEFNLLNVSATVIGAVALIFLAKGDIWAQILMIAFCILYAVRSYDVSYWGELITYACMTLPMSVIALVSWLRNPYEGDRNEVSISRLTLKKLLSMIFFTALVTAAFYFILKGLHTPNLAVSTLSITTSFAAVYLTYLRSSWYAVAYGCNDIVVVILWILMSLEDPSNLPMVANFGMFFINDIYGFISWKKREIKQQKGL